MTIIVKPTKHLLKSEMNVIFVQILNSLPLSSYQIKQKALFCCPREWIYNVNLALWGRLERCKQIYSELVSTFNKISRTNYFN